MTLNTLNLTNIRLSKAAQKRVSRGGVQWIQKAIALVVLVCLSSTATLAVPEAPVTLYSTIVELKEDLHHNLAKNGFGTSIFSFNSLLEWVASFGSKRRVIDRIVISPADENGSLSVMQGERVTFAATGYSGEDAVNGLSFKWGVQDEAQKRPKKELNGSSFQAIRPGAFVVTATAENGQQAQITVTVKFNEGYGIQRLIEKKDSDRTSEERQGIATMVQKGYLTSRNIDSRAVYSAASERTLSDIDKAKLAAVKAKQLEVLQQNPNLSQSSQISIKTPKPDTVGQRVKKRKGGPSAGDEDIENLTDAQPNNVKTKPATSKSLAVRPVDNDGWDGTNWYTADDPGNATGTPAGASLDAGAGNGDYHLVAPVLSLLGRGIDVNLNLVYNSRLWSKSGTVMSYDSDKGSPAPGWNIGFGKMMYMGGTGGCMLVTPDGTRRSYTGTPNVYSNGTYYQNLYVGHTTDGSFIDYGCLYYTGTNGSGMSGYATLPNGTTVTYGSPTTVYDQAFPTQITDSQGNYITITYANNHGPNIETITDTLGRVIVFNYDHPGRLISVTGPGYNNTTRTYVRLHYKLFTLNFAFASGYTTDTPTNSPYLLDSIYYPDTNTGYWFNDSDSYSSYGMIAKVVQQRGMSFYPIQFGTQGQINAGTTTDQKTYNFTLAADPSLTDAPTYTNLTESWAGMDTAPVEINYDDTKTSTDEVISVTLPDGTVNKQTSHIDTGFYYQGEVYASGASTPLTKTKTFLGNGDYGTSRPTRAEVTDELGHTTATDFTYAANSYNQLITQKEYGYNGTLYRQTNNTYDNNSNYISRHIFNLLKTTETMDASGNRLTRTEYQYDNNAEVNGTGSPNLVHADGVVMHNSTSDPFTTETTEVQGACLLWNPETNSEPPCDHEGQLVYLPDYQSETYCSCEEWETYQASVYNPSSIFRGNVTKTTVYSNAANLAGAISYDFTYDITGNQSTATTNCCQQTSFDYTDSFSDSTNHHAFAYPKLHTKGSSDTNSSLRMTESAVYDFNTGALVSSTDFNGLTTTTGYDSLTRPTLVTMPTGGKKATDYDDANLTATQTVKLSDNTTVVTESVSVLNGRGQPILSKYLSGATNFNVTSTQYDEMGRKKKTYLPYDSASSPGPWTEYTYDALSRVTQVTSKQQDGSPISTSKSFYNETARPDSASASIGQTVRSQDEWGRERWARTDDFGRLAEVVEPNPSGTGNTPSINAALASNGGVATGSSTYTSGYAASGTNNGDRKGLNWGTSGGWNDNTSNSYPDSLQVDFNSSKTIGEIDVFTLQDNYTSPSEPTETMTFSTWGVTAFDVQYWNGSGWVTVPSGSVTGNNKVWRKFTFTPVTTSKIRVVVNGALQNYSRITEVEAWTQATQSNATGSVFDPGSLKTSYSYDALDQLTGVSQGVQTRSFKYDSLGRLTRQKLAEQTATINDLGTYVGEGGTGAAWSDAFNYDVRSNITNRTDARGVQTTFSYNISANPDPLNRLQSISYSTSGADATHGTISSAASVSLSYMTAGDQTRVASVTTSGVATETNTYDSQSRISDYTLTLTNRSSYPMTTSYEYDTANRLTKVKYPVQYTFGSAKRKEVVPSYDQTSRISQMNVENVGDASATQLSDISYNTFGQVTSLKTGLSTGNADVEQYSYDNQTGLLTNQKVYKASNMTSPLLDLSYEYNRGNSVGTLSGKTGQLTHITNNLDHNKDRVYEFDALGRLTKGKGGAATGITGPTANWTQAYAYDRYGNKSSVTATGITADGNAVPLDGLASLGYDAATNRITPNGSSGWQYDNAGNLIRGQNQSGVWQRFEYDAAGRLVKIKDDAAPSNVIETYTYGADRNRLINEYSGGRTYYAWGGSSVLQEYTEATASTTPVYSKSYTYAGSRLLSTATNISGTEVFEFHHPNTLGTQLITNPSANSSFEQSTLPFGTALNAESSGFSTKAFTSYERSSSTGVDYAINRTYSSGQGRFTQVDPAGIGAVSISNPQSLNLYAYVQNDPTNLVDPTGLLIQIYYHTECDIDGAWLLETGEVRYSNCHGVIDAIYYIPDGPMGGQDPSIGGGVGEPIPGNSPTPKAGNCNTLAALITRVRDELAKRGSDLIQNLLNLPPTGPMSIAGHVQQFENKQAQLRKALNEFNTNGCNGPGPKNPIPADAWEWATKAAPEQRFARNPQGGNVPNNNLVEIGAGIVVSAATAYALYRIIRLLPSAAPPLWWTLPANLAIP